jgi:hypothetical protein
MSRNHRVLVPSHIARLMSPEDRKANGIQTPEEESAAANLTLERDIHSQFGSWLYRHDFWDYYHSDPVRRPTIKAGLPDFGIYRDSRILFLEIKVKPNGLTASQEEVFARMGAAGNVILIVYSYEEACRVTAKFFNLL